MTASKFVCNGRHFLMMSPSLIATTAATKPHILRCFLLCYLLMKMKQTFLLELLCKTAVCFQTNYFIPFRVSLLNVLGV